MDTNNLIADLEELEVRLSRFVERTRIEHVAIVEFERNRAEIRNRLASAIGTVDSLIREGKTEKKNGKTATRKSKTPAAKS
jgi:hypothetical protein